jgi:ribosomal protein L40E
VSDKNKEHEHTVAELKGATLQTYALCTEICNKCTKRNSRLRGLLCRRCNIHNILRNVDKLLRMVETK